MPNKINPEIVQDCYRCDQEPQIPDPVDGGDHHHYQIVCNKCGIEVINLDPEECANVWNDIMSPHCDCVYE